MTSVLERIFHDRLCSVSGTKKDRDFLCLITLLLQFKTYHKLFRFSLLSLLLTAFAAALWQPRLLPDVLGVRLPLRVRTLPWEVSLVYLTSFGELI